MNIRNKRFLYLAIIGILTMFIVSDCSGKNGVNGTNGAQGPQGPVGVQGPQGALGLPMPIIQSTDVQGLPAKPGSTVTATVIAQSAQGLGLGYTWTAYDGWIVTSGGSSPTATITAPNTYGASGTATITVYDTQGMSATGMVAFNTQQSAYPIINGVTASPNPVAKGRTTIVTVSATDTNGDGLTYTWTVSNNWSVISGGNSQTAMIKAPDTYSISGTATATVCNPQGNCITQMIGLSTEGNTCPVINGINAIPNPVDKAGTITATVQATDPDGDGLAYTWTVSNGWTITTGANTSTATITAPDKYDVKGTATVIVSDNYGGYTSQSIGLSTENNVAPIIESLSATPNPVNAGGIITATVQAIDPDGDGLTYTWTVSNGWTITTGANTSTATITAPGNYNTSGTATVIVSDGNGGYTIRLIPINTVTILTYTADSAPWGIAIDASGNVWVTNYNSNNVTELNSSGTTIGTYAVGWWPSGIAIDAFGNVWVTNGGSNNVTELSSSGTTIGTYAVGSQPWAIAIDASGNVWVTNGGSANVTKLNSSGTTIGTYAVGSQPWAIAIDASGNVWVANLSSNNVTKLNSSGTTIGTYAVGKGLSGIAIDTSGNVWVTGLNVTELNSSGTTIGTYTVGSGAVDIDASGNVWVTNGGANVIKIIGVAKGPQYWPYTGPQWP